METNDALYRRLQKHLDHQPVGFPAVKTGADIRLLQRFFTVDEVPLVLALNYKPRSLADIRAELGTRSPSPEELEQRLEAIVKRGAIGHVVKDGQRCFYTIPLVVGMYEGQLGHLTPEFLADFEAYTADRSFGLEFLSTELPQMRTIPVERSITPEHHVATYDQLTSLITESSGPFVINECICRKTSAMKGEPCRQTSQTESCMALGRMAQHCLDAGLGREITREEAMDITRRNEADGLVLQPNNAQEVEFICACCGCCCGILKMQKALPRPVEFWSTNFFAVVDDEACTGCGTCEERCQVDAIRVEDDGGTARVNLARCIGCGLCVPTCPSTAIGLEPRKKQTAPPATSEELYETIMQHKKGPLGKAKLVMKLMRKS